MQAPRNKSDKLRDVLMAELARREFWHFCVYMDPELFLARPFLKPIAEAFQEIEEGKIKSLSVSLPPRAAKSYITSLFCAWVIGRNPSESVMRNTCTATLYLKFSYDVRAIVKSDKYMRVFKTRLSDDKANLNGWNTDSAKMVSYFGAGVGGTIIGFGATKCAITDDLYRGMEDALSDTINERILQWKESTHDSRMESGCARIDIGTRWIKKDVIGVQMEDNIYDKSIIIPALDEDGNSFCEAVMTTEEYEERRSRMAEEIWMAEYMQQPIDIKGRLFSGLNVIERSDYEAIQSKCDGYIAYIDVSDQGKDYTAMAIAAIHGNDVYIVDYVFTKDNTDITIPLCSAKLNKWSVKYCRVESNSMGAMFSRHLQRETKTKILQVHNQTNKITRIIMHSAFVNGRMKFVNTGDQHYRLFMENLLAFSKDGKNKNDDAPDAITGLSMFITSLFKHLN